MAEIRVGCATWSYKDWIAKAGKQSYFELKTKEDRKNWVGPFFLRGTRPADMLTEYAKVFDTVEVDSSFYAIPPETNVQGWFDRSPDNFIFSFKMPREITHFRRLKNCEEILEPFCQRVRLMKHKLGAINIQMPPNFTPKQQPALEAFLPALPQDLRFAIEFRDKSWATDEILALLKQYGVAFALTDSDKFPRELSFSLIDKPTASFAYVRWLGKRVLNSFTHAQIDRGDAVKEWAQAFKHLSKNVPVIYAYFTNHFQGHSPYSAIRFKEALKLPVPTGRENEEQPGLF